MKAASKARALLFLFLVCIPNGRAQTETKVPDTAAFIQDFYAAYKTKNAARISEFYTENATFVDPSFELHLKGRDQIRDVMTRVLAKYESLDWEITNTIPSGENLVVEGTMIGKLGPKTVRVPFVSIFQFTGEKISVQHDLFDVLHVLVQLGVVPPPFEPKPPALASPTPK